MNDKNSMKHIFVAYIVVFAVSEKLLKIDKYIYSLHFDFREIVKDKVVPYVS